MTETLRSEPHGAYPMVAYDEGGVACGKEGKVTILNPSDSQGNQVADSDGIYPTLRGCGGAGYQQGYLFERKNSTTVFGISSYNSNAMKSSNPHSGIYEADTSRTLDLNGGNPACNQGGMAVVQGADMYNGSLTGDIAATLNASSCVSGGQSGPSVVCIEGNGQRESHKGDGYKESDTMYTLNTVEHHAVAYRKTSHAKSAEDGQGWAETEVNDTLNAFDSGETRTPTVVLENHPQDSRVKISSTVGTLNCMHDQQAVMTYQEHTGTVDACIGKGTSNQLANNDMFVANTSVVRRLTPLECERLQGYPDGWTDLGEWVDSKGKKRKDSDSPRYKALGNSIALPFWQWMAHKMVKYIDGHQPTMASLFSGIGGFELVFSRAGCEPVWCSEIEEFPIAVTKYHFPDNE